MDEMIRVLLADDHTVLRAGLASLLAAESDMLVVGQASTGEEAVEKARSLRPDVVVMDLDMPGQGGLAATRQITATDQGARVLVLTMQEEANFLLPVLEAGGSGYVNKASAESDLIAAIRVVAQDDVYLYPNAAKLLLRGYRKAQAKDQENPLDELSERERQVLALTAEGYSSKAIGKRLDISSKTVDTYRSRITQKLGLQSRSELVRFALKTGLLNSEAMVLPQKSSVE